MVEIYLEIGKTKIVACARAWPGWCRFGKTEQQAIESLLNTTSRYQLIAERAGIAFVPENVEVVERITGDATTDWGAPSIIIPSDTQPVDAIHARQGVAILRASWAMMDELIAIAPSELRKGPRGGGRDRDQVVGHVIEVERAYARKIGVQHKPFSHDDRNALTALREEIATTLDQPSDGSLLTPSGWPASYAIRRITWHVIDHLWEIEDRQS
jgi:hypothetical protein